MQKIPLIFVGLLIPIAMGGCRGTGRSPFGFAAKPPVVAQQNQTAAQSSPTMTAANDTVSQQIAAESKALSDRLTVANNPELKNYVSSNDDEYRSASTPARTGSFSSVSSAASGGCSSGCRH